MGTGIHGGFGLTAGRHSSSKAGKTKSVKANYTKEQLIDFIDGITPQSSKIADYIRKGKISINVLGDELFERAFGVDSNVIGLAIGNRIYIRRDSVSIYSDLVHEGTHALDYLEGISYENISSIEGEFRAYKAEHLFQRAAKLPVEFANEDDIKIHLWINYRRKDTEE